MKALVYIRQFSNGDIQELTFVGTATVPVYRPPLHPWEKDERVLVGYDLVYKYRTPGGKVIVLSESVATQLIEKVVER